MKNIFITILVILFSLQIVLAINIEVEKVSSDEVMINKLSSPATFDLKIKNLGADDRFNFYNLLGFEMFPIGNVPISAGETEDVQIKISPIGELNHHGLYTFPYYIRGQDGTESEQKLTFRVINLDEAFEIGSGEFNPESNSLKIYIQNKVNFNFLDVDTKFKSSFFEFNENFDLKPNEKKEFTIEVDKEDMKKLIAGFYTFTSEIEIKDQKIKLEGTIKFSEKSLIKTAQEDYGFIVQTQVIEKTNQGNTITKSTTTIEKNIISRLFTSFNPSPDIAERQGFGITYTWDNQIKPGESIKITVKTNWLFPLFMIAFIIAIVIFAKQYSGRNDISLNKKITFVNAKGGEFALKITINVHAKNYIERVNIIDRVPSLVKIYPKFGREEPTRINEKTKRIEWNFEKLEAGEIRVITYIIYSKVGVLGKFALPTATAIYEKNGRLKEIESNKAFFVSEQKGVDLEE